MRLHIQYRPTENVKTPFNLIARISKCKNVLIMQNYVCAGGKTLECAKSQQE